VSRLINHERLLILSFHDRIIFYNVDKITVLRNDIRDNELAIVYDGDTKYFKHPQGSRFFFTMVKSVLIDLKTGKISSYVIEIEEV
jgi:hypothetical protein